MYGPLIKKINDEGRKIQDMKPEYAAEGKEVLDNQRRIYKHLKNKDLSDKAIAAIMGNINHETGGTFDYQQKEKGARPEDQGYGLIQLTPGSQRLLSPYMNWLVNKYDIQPNTSTPGTPISGMRNKIMSFDSPENQLDFMLDAIYTKGGVPNPNNEDGYFIGPGNAASIRTVLDNPKASLAEHSSIIVDHMLNPGEKKLKPKQYKDRIKDTKNMYSLIESGSLDPVDPGLSKTLKNKFKDVNIPVPSLSDIPNPLSNIKKKASSFAEKVKDFVDPNNIGLPNLNFSSNKFEMPERSGIFDYKNNGGKVQHLDPGGIVYPTLDDKDNIMELIFGSDNNNIPKPNPLSSIEVPADDTTTISGDMSLPPKPDPIAFGMEDPDLGATLDETPMYGTPTYMSSYDKMVQDELSGSPAYEIPPVFQQIDPDMYDQETGDELLKVDKPMEVGITKPEVDVLSNRVLEQSPGATESAIISIQGQLEDEYNNLQAYLANGGDEEGAELFRNNIRNLENQLDSFTKRQALIDFQEKYKGDMAEIKKQQDLQNNITNLENQVNNPNITETERNAASQALDNLNKQKDTTEVTTPLEESQSKLAAVANNLNTAKEAELKQDLDSDAGKAAQNDANQSQGTPAYEQAKGVLNFLFGDLIDGQELGRGIAIYLASRALGYDHNDTIGYVAKNYLKRVDTKNALMDKFIKENAGKYTKKSLADYKRTGDPNVLSPIGSTPRPQGEEKTYYNAAGQARVAYKFKKKNAQGDDFTYWSWDKDGGDVKQRVSSAWTSDGSDVQGSDPYNEKINKAADRIVGQMKSFKEGKDKTKEKNIDKGIMQNVYKTDIQPEFAAREVAAWADKNGFEVYEMGPGIQQAWTMAIAAADEAEAQGIDVSITSLLPYLEEATIKQRLDNLKGVPPVSTAIVNGNKIEMNPSELVILNGKINNVTGDVNRFWNTVAKVYKGNDKESGKPWKKIFEQHVIDSGENITPFALFGQVYLENIMEGMANQ